MSNTSTHFVRYRMKDPRHTNHHITFRSSAPGEPPSVATHPVVTSLAGSVPGAADRIQRLSDTMIAHESGFFAWLGTDTANTELFIADPTAALRQGAPDIPPTFYEELASLPKILKK